jgi:hypothetical protein
MTMEIEIALTPREAALRSAAATSLAGIALAQAIELPSLLVEGRQFGVLSIVAMALCVGLGWALATAPAGAARRLWRVVAAAAVLVLAGWAAPHARAVPGLAAGRGHWTAMPGAACGALAAVSLLLAVAAAPPARATARGLATAVAVLLALAPGVGVLFVALGPGLAGGETVLAAGSHIHSQGSPESAIQYQPIAGGHGGHYVYRAVAAPHPTAIGLTLLVAAALVFTYGAVGCLRRRSAPAELLIAPGVESRLA